MSSSVKVWSPYQERIYDFGVNGKGNAIVKAVAGSGKTTTLVELIKRMQSKFPGMQPIFLAFNKSIAEELKSRGVNARTFHSLTYGPVTNARKVREVRTEKMRDVIDARLGDDESRLYSQFLQKLVGLGKQQGIGCLVEDTEANWVELANHHDLQLDNDRADFAQAIKYASLMLQASNNAQSLDFDDLLYLAVKDGISLPKFDLVLVDEAQDTNAIQRAILRKIMRPNARLIAVGDPAQAIYGFRGADSEAINMIKSEFDAVELPLTVSYRCPTAVVAHAQKWVKHIEAAPSAPEGKVVEVDEWDHKAFTSTDLIVCRTTAPVIGLAFRLLSHKIPARILGRDIGAGLKSLIKRLNAKGVDALEMKVDEWREREVEKVIAKRQEALAESLHDKAHAIKFLIRSLQETRRTIPALLELIDTLFSDKANAVTLSTIHKSKGLEAPRVFWLNSSKCPAKWARQEWQQEQERNLCYVATTRAQQELHLIEDSGYTDRTNKPKEK
jgi:superfamily I DNA/RNA helicase